MLNGPAITPITDKQQFVNDVRDALFAAKIISYAQGFSLIRAAAKVFGLYSNIVDAARAVRRFYFV